MSALLSIAPNLSTLSNLRTLIPKGWCPRGATTIIRIMTPFRAMASDNCGQITGDFAGRLIVATGNGPAVRSPHVWTHLWLPTGRNLRKIA